MISAQSPVVRASTIKSGRAWLVSAVAATSAAAFVAVAWAWGSGHEQSSSLGVVAVAVAVGAPEVAYLVWRGWALGQRGLSGAAAGSSSIGALLIMWATVGVVGGRALVPMAAGVGLLGIAAALGLLGVYRATGKSTAGTGSAMVIVLALAYFASGLWAAIP